MDARFKAVGTFHLQSRRLFVIYGDVTEGEVRPGMRVELPLNSGLVVTGRIDAVEFVDMVPQQRAYVGLVLGYDDPDELKFWEAMNIADEELRILDGGTQAAR